MKIVTVLGTRPEIIKLSPLLRLFSKSFESIIIHTGQHYSPEMDINFFEELGLQKPNFMLKVGSGTHASQTGRIMIEIENILLRESPNVVVVQGDTNSALGGALAAFKLN